MRIVSEPAFGQIFVSDTNRQHLDETVEAVGSDYRIFTVDNGVCRQEEAYNERRDPVLLGDVMRQFLDLRLSTTMPTSNAL